MEYKGNITLPTYDQYCEEFLKDKVNRGEKVKCSNCDGYGEIEEEVQSRQGNWHAITEDCEECEGSGEIYADELSSSMYRVGTGEYKLEMIETVRKLSSWTRTDFFLNLCKCKGLFNG